MHFNVMHCNVSATKSALRKVVLFGFVDTVTEVTPRLWLVVVLHLDGDKLWEVATECRKLQLHPRLWILHTKTYEGPFNVM